MPVYGPGFYGLQPRQFPLRPYTDRELGLEAVPRTAPDEEEPGADNEDDD